MPEMIYRTTTSMDGPWLVDVQSLTSLDEILETELEKLTDIRKRALDIPGTQYRFWKKGQDSSEPANCRLPGRPK